MAKITLLIAEDTTLVRRLLVYQLEREPDFEIIGEAENGRDAIDFATTLRPDVILMDLELPFCNGLEATERILAKHPFIRVVLLTSHEDLASMGKRAGASACLNKGCTPAELVDTIRQVYHTRTPGGSEDEVREDHSAVIERLAMRAGLTEREQAVLAKVLETEYSGAQIARALSDEWNQPVTDSAVKHTIDRVMTKLRIEPRTRAALIKYVLESASVR